MDSVFIYWDNSNVFHEVQRLAEECDEAPNARFRVRLNFDNLLRLAQADRPLVRAFAAGSIPPETRQLWNRMENKGLQASLFDRGGAGQGARDLPNWMLQFRMLEDALDFNGDPGIAVLLTGDGAGYLEGAGFHRALERMRRKGWRVEVLSWAQACNARLRKWAEAEGIFVPLEEHYEAVTFLEPSRPGHEFAQPRRSAPLDLARRPTVGRTLS